MDRLPITLNYETPPPKSKPKPIPLAIIAPLAAIVGVLFLVGVWVLLFWIVRGQR